MTRILTDRQKEILDYIIECIRDEGRPPTVAEIGERYGIASTNGVNDHLLALKKKGYIERSSKARSIRVTDKAMTTLYRPDAGTLPLIGRVAAGLPALAQENVESQVEVPMSLAARKAFCLRVRGDSMVDAGMLDGDIIVVDASLRPTPGDIVVALVDDDATVKRFYPRGDVIELRPENSRMQTILAPAESVKIQGVVVALQRTLK